MQEVRKDINNQRRQSVTWHTVYFGLAFTVAIGAYTNFFKSPVSSSEISGFILFFGVVYYINLCLFFIIVAKSLSKSDLPIFSSLDEEVGQIKLKNGSLNKDILKKIEQNKDELTLEYKQLCRERKWFKGSFFCTGCLIIISTISIPIQKVVKGHSEVNTQLQNNRVITNQSE